DRMQFADRVAALASLEPADVTRAIRVWRVVLLQELLAGMPPPGEQVVEDVIALEEFWEGFVDWEGNESAGPAPEFVFRPAWWSPDAYARLLADHRSWLAAERAELGLAPAP